jgi:hypothetical protein
VKDKPKATPPGQAKKHERPAHANGNAGKEKVKKVTKSKDALPALEQAAPTSEQVVTPEETDVVQGNGQGGEEKEKGPKKQRWA